MAIEWTPEELAEMAAYDAAVDLEPLTAQELAEKTRRDREARRKRTKEAEYARAYYAANREKINERQRAYRAANREKLNERQRAYRAANREKLNERQRAYRAALKGAGG